MIREQHKPLIDLTRQADHTASGLFVLPEISLQDLQLLVRGLKAVRYKAKKSITPGFIPAEGAVDVNYKRIGDCTRLIDQYQHVIDVHMDAKPG